MLRDAGKRQSSETRNECAHDYRRGRRIRKEYVQLHGGMLLRQTGGQGDPIDPKQTGIHGHTVLAEGRHCGMEA